MTREEGSRNESISIWNRVKALAPIIGVVIGVIGLLNPWFIGSTTGQFDKPELQLQLGQHDLDPDVTTRIFLGAPISQNPGIAIATLPFAVRNHGEKTATEVEVIDRLPAIARSPLHGEILSFKTRELFAASSKIVNKRQKFRGYSYFSYSIPSIHPGSGAAIREPFLLMKPKDEYIDQNSGISVAPRLAFRQQFTLLAKDQGESNYLLDIEVIQAQNEEEFSYKVVESLSEELTEQREDLPFLASFLSPVEIRALTIFTKPEVAAEHKGVELYTYSFPQDDITTIAISDEPYKWVYLLLLIGAIFALLRRDSIRLAFLVLRSPQPVDITLTDDENKNQLQHKESRGEHREDNSPS